MGSAVATATMGPAGAALAGVTALSAGRIARDACDDRRAKEIWGTVSDLGGDTLKGLALGKALGGAADLFGGPAYKMIYDKSSVVVDSGVEFGWKHASHLGKGINYDSDCPVCNFPGE